MRSAHALLATLTLALPALGLAQYRTSYTVDRPIGDDFAITDVFMIEQSDGSGSLTWPFSVPGGSPSTTLVNPFSFATRPTRSLLIGIAQDLPGDAEGQKHLVLMMDDEAAALSEHIAWGTLFRNTDEDQLIADVELGASGQGFSVIQPGLDGISAFADGDAKTGILDPLAQPRSAFFTPGGTFTVVAWSDGRIIGTGTSAVAFTPVPEPASFAALGLGALALIRRRKA